LLRAQYRVELSKQDYISAGTRAEIHADESLDLRVSHLPPVMRR
jgi:hypothetical protein